MTSSSSFRHSANRASCSSACATWNSKAPCDDLWDSLCSQVIFGSTDFADLDARIVRASRIAQLRTQIAKLEGDHARAKTQERRNEAHAKLRKARAQLESLEQL